MEKLMSFSRRFLSLLLCLAVLASLYMGFPVISDASVPTVTVITGSDYQPSSSTQPYSYCEGVMKGLKNSGVDPYGVLMCGDYSGGFSSSASQTGISEIKSLISANFGTVNQQIYVQGNHDPASSAGLTSSGAHDTEYYGVYVLNDDDYGWYNGDPNNMSDGMGGHEATIKASAESMRAYFAKKLSEGYDKPIFIATHIPLHNSFRTRAYKDGQYAMHIVDVLNEAGAAGLNIIYLYGHNHSGRSDDYIGGGSVFLTRGDTMFVAQLGNVAATPVEVPLNFTYMNSGYVGYIANGNPGGNILNMAVFEITGNKVTVKRCSKDGFVPVRAQGAWWTGEESATTYATTDAYLKPASGLTMNLTSNYNGWNMVNTYGTPTTVYSLVPSFTSGGTYVIANSNTAGSALAVKYVQGVTGTQSVTVTMDSQGPKLSGVTADVEWTWTAVSDVYGVLKGSGGRYLQIDGQTNGTLRTTSDYTQTDSGNRHSMWRMSPSSGLYAYVYGTTYSGTDGRSYVRSDGTNFVTRNYGDLANTSTKPIYIYQKTTAAPITTYWVKVEGTTDYTDTPMFCFNWESTEKKIRSNLVVTVKDGTGATHATTDYTLGKVDIFKTGYTLVPVYYKGEVVGGVTLYLDYDAGVAKIKKLAYNSNYYVSKNPDVKTVFGDNSSAWVKHFIEYGVKEGREASPIFNIQYYAANNPHVKEMFGNDRVAIMEYYMTVGYKEACYTAAHSDLGDNFYATIGTAITASNVLSFSGTNVAMYKKDSSDNQIWHFIKQANGTYEIVNLANGLALTVENNGLDAMTNVVLAKNVHASGQQWFLYETTGGYYLRPLCTGECVLDIYAANTANGANVIIYSSNCTDAQKFVINKCTVVEDDKPIDLGSDFIGNLKVNGSNIAVGTTGTNATVDSFNEDDRSQKFYFMRQDDGSYKIVSTKSKFKLGADAAVAGGQVYVAVDNSEMEIDKWFIFAVGDMYVIKAAGAEELALSTQNNQLTAGADIIVDTFSSAESQKFTITNLGKVDYEIPEKTDTGVLTSEQVTAMSDILKTVDTSLKGQNIDSKIAEYAKVAFDLGIKDIKGIMLCVNIGFIGGESEITRIAAQCGDTYSINSIYSALLTDTGTQAGAYRNRNLNAYRLISKI